MAPRPLLDSNSAVLSAHTSVRGRIAGTGSLLLEGVVEGDIAIDGDFTLTESARATADVDARDVVVSGTLEGAVRARGDVRVVSGATLRGDVTGTSFVLEEGAAFVGRLDAEFDLPTDLGGSESLPQRAGTRTNRRN
jgi:cytoskeletal protein CcmA (bactofilin family)